MATHHDTSSNHVTKLAAMEDLDVIDDFDNRPSTQPGTPEEEDTGLMRLTCKNGPNKGRVYYGRKDFLGKTKFVSWEDGNKSFTQFDYIERIEKQLNTISVQLDKMKTVQNQIFYKLDAIARVKKP